MSIDARRRRRTYAPALLSLCLAAACARDDVRTAGDSSAAAAESVAAGMPQEGAGSAVDTVRAPAGSWTLALAENKLRATQLPPIRQGTQSRRPGLGVPGTRYSIGGSQLEIFLYADAIARGRDTDALDPVQVAPGAVRPALITDGNLAALLFSTDAPTVARVRAALRTESNDGPLEPAGVVPPRGAPESSP